MGRMSELVMLLEDVSENPNEFEEFKDIAQSIIRGEIHISEAPEKVQDAFHSLNIDNIEDMIEGYF